jgi:hypothetical protein
MKAIIDADELYPFYSVVTFDMDGYGEPIEVPDELIKRSNDCMEEFWKIQNELRKIKEKDNES